MKVDMEPAKPARTPCPHECRAGCGIYADRPEPCRVFQCGWLAAQDWEPEARLPRAMRPDLSGVVLEVNSVGYIVAHSDRLGSWRRQPMHRWLLAMARRTRVLIELGGDRVELLDGSGSTHPLDFVGIDPESNERLYRRRGKAA